MDAAYQHLLHTGLSMVSRRKLKHLNKDLEEKFGTLNVVKPALYFSRRHEPAVGAAAYKD